MPAIPQQAYPLTWPAGRPRTAEPKPNYNFAAHTVAECVDAITRNVRLTGADHVVISTNLTLRKDGLPMSGQANPRDPGVAVYFQYKGKPVCLACDAWQSVSDNLRAIVLTLEAMRGLDRWGAASLESTFTGYAALPAPAAAESWWEVLQVPRTASPADVTRAYRQRCLETHPDAGGSHEAFVRVRAAYDAYQKENPENA